MAAALAVEGIAAQRRQARRNAAQIPNSKPQRAVRMRAWNAAAGKVVSIHVETLRSVAVVPAVMETASALQMGRAPEQIAAQRKNNVAAAQHFAAAL